MDDDLFAKLLTTESVFKDAKSIAQAWVPGKEQKLLCRDSEIAKLLSIHRPIIDEKGEFSVNTLILGNGGIGKTLTVKFFVGRFKDLALKKEIKIMVEYYDCLQHRTKSSILRNISAKLHFSEGHGYSDNEIMQQILRVLKKNEEYLVIILDEVHNLSPDDILAMLNTSIGFGEKNSRFCIMCVSRPADWYKVENEKIMSRIQDIIRMGPYKSEEALVILKYRRDLAFRSGVLEDDVLGLIRDIVVETANMRNGIDIMRACGHRADELKTGSINTEMVRNSRNDIHPTFQAEVIDRLKTHEQLSLLSIARVLMNKKDPFTMVDDAYEQYQIVCEEKGVKPHVKMSYRKYLRNLSEQKAVSSDYMNPTVEKKGRQLKIQLTDISAEKLAEMLEQRLPEKISDTPDLGSSEED
jgi:cell division control protein 6